MLQHFTPVPLPYLTALYKAYARDHTALKWYILPPITRFVSRAVECAQRNVGPEVQAADRASARQEFVEEVYFSAASTQLKKDLFELPLNDLFDICVVQFRGTVIFCEGDDEEMEEACMKGIGTYINRCVLHVDCDTDGSLQQLLRQHKAVHSELNTGNQLLSNFDEQMSIIPTRTAGPWPGMTQLLREVMFKYVPNKVDQNAFDSADIVSTLRQLIQLAMNAVDVRLLHINTDEGNAMATEGCSTIIWAWNNMLLDPFSDVPLHVKKILAGLNVIGSIELLLNYIIGRALGTGVKPEHLHFAVYTIVVAGALDENVWNIVDRNILVSAIEPNFSFPPYVQGCLIPEYFRPEGTWDQVTDELTARLRQNGEFDDSSDVPVEPIGPPIDPRSLGQTATDALAGETCTVCLENFADSDEEVVKLNACQHFIHLECLDVLANQAYPGHTAIRCPYCRAELCASRDYQAVLEK